MNGRMWLDVIDSGACTMLSISWSGIFCVYCLLIVTSGAIAMSVSDVLAQGS